LFENSASANAFSAGEHRGTAVEVFFGGDDVALTIKSSKMVRIEIRGAVVQDSDAVMFAEANEWVGVSDEVSVGDSLAVLDALFDLDASRVNECGDNDMDADAECDFVGVTVVVGEAEVDCDAVSLLDCVSLMDGDGEAVMDKVTLLLCVALSEGENVSVPTSVALPQLKESVRDFVSEQLTESVIDGVSSIL
jgi:hypothetical protein